MRHKKLFDDFANIKSSFYAFSVQEHLATNWRLETTNRIWKIVKLMTREIKKKNILKCVINQRHFPSLKAWKSIL